MPKYHVEVSCTKTEKYLVEAANKTEAEDNVFLDGELLSVEEESECITGVTLVKRKDKP